SPPTFSGGIRAPGLSRSHLDSAVELSCLDTIFSLSSCLSQFSLEKFCARITQQRRSPTRLTSSIPCFVASFSFRPRRAWLFGYCAVVRTPLRLPTTDAATPPTFEPRQPPLVFWHFFLRAPQASVPICADHCLLQKAPECSVLPAPSSFADTGLLLC